MFLAFKTLEHYLDDILGWCIWLFCPAMFIVFLVLFILNVRKFKEDKKRKIKSIVFGCISGYFLLTSIGEALLMMMLAAAVAHM